MNGQSEIKTKYTKISFNEEHDGGTSSYWAAISMAWGKSDSPIAVAFATLMDGRLLFEARRQLESAVHDPIKDIYLDDVCLLVILREDVKYLGAKLIGIVHAVEAEFDSIAESGKEIVK